MDVREKIVEILKQAPFEGKVLDEWWWEEKIKRIADHLISNGVTVQEWISVDEKLPQNFISVLGYMRDAGEFPPVRECYTVGNVFIFPALGDIHPVSHWCEIPKPPKGE